MMLLLVAVKDVGVYINSLILNHHKETICVFIVIAQQKYYDRFPCFNLIHVMCANDTFGYAGTSRYSYNNICNLYLLPKYVTTMHTAAATAIL